MPKIGDVVVAFTAETSGFARETARVRTSLDGVNRQAGGSAQLFNKLERALGGAAFAAAGLPGPFGRVASTLLQFSTGGVVTLAVIAGIGAMGLAWDRLTSKARASAEAHKKVVDDLLEQARALLEIPKGLQALVVIEGLQAEQSALLSQIAARASATRTTGGGTFDLLTGKMSKGVTTPAFGPDDKMLVGLRQQLDTVNRALEIARGALRGMTTEASESAAAIDRELTQGITDFHQALAAVQPDIDRFMRGFVDAVSMSRLATQWHGVVTEWEHLRDLGTQLAPIVERLKTDSEKLGDDVGKVLKAVEDGLISAEIGSDLWQRLIDEFQAGHPELTNDFAALGRDIGKVFAHTFVRSFMEGFKGFGDVLKTLFEEVLLRAMDLALDKAFEAISKKKKDKEGGVLGSLLKIGAQVGLALATQGASVPVQVGTGAVFAGAPMPSGGGIILAGPPTAPRDPMSAARDAEWMHFLGESIRNYQAGGGRLG